MKTRRVTSPPETSSPTAPGLFRLVPLLFSAWLQVGQVGVDLYEIDANLPCDHLRSWPPTRPGPEFLNRVVLVPCALCCLKTLLKATGLFGQLCRLFLLLSLLSLA